MVIFKRLQYTEEERDDGEPVTVVSRQVCYKCWNQQHEQGSRDQYLDCKVVIAYNEFHEGTDQCCCYGPEHGVRK